MFYLFFSQLLQGREASRLNRLNFSYEVCLLTNEILNAVFKKLSTLLLGKEDRGGVTPHAWWNYEERLPRHVLQPIGYSIIFLKHDRNNT